MEYRSGVLAGRSEGEKVKGRPRARVAKDLAFQISRRGMDCNRHGRTDRVLDCGWAPMNAAKLMYCAGSATLRGIERWID